MDKNDKRVYLDLNYAFGSNCSAGFKDCVGIMEQDKSGSKIVFSVGKCIAKKSFERNDMEFIRLSDNLESIQCMCISPQKTHVAICEKPKNQNILIMTLYSLKAMDTQKKVFRYVPNAKMKASTFKAFAFSPSQQKFMCCLTGDPDYQLLFIDNSRMRALAFSNFSIKDVTRIAISPNQSHLISASGKNFFKLYKVQQYAFKPLQDVKKLPKNRNFTQHAWSQKTKILLGTDRGQVFLIMSIGNKYQVKRQFLNAFNQPTADIAITAICSFSRGFILGSNNGKFTLWVKKQDQQQNYEDQQTVDLVRKWSTSPERQSEVTCIDISSKQDTIIIAFKNNDIATIDMNQVLPQTLETVEALKKTSQKSIFFDYLFKGFHNAPITGMDVCLQRPLLATCSKYDNTIRIWNYKNPRCQLLRMFSFKNKQTGLDQKSMNPLINLAFHPTGYYIAVGCVDKLRFYHILNTELRPYRQIVVKGACQLKFSRGGNWLAVAYPLQKYNAHSINIYNAYTLQQLVHLSQHNNVITDLQWTKNDDFLISSSLDGSFIQWKTQDWTFKKFMQTNSKYSSVLLNPQSGIILSCGTQSGKNIVRQIKMEKDRQIYQKVHHTTFKINKMKLLLSHWNYPAIIAGTDDGSVKVYNSGFDNLVQQSLNSHSKQIVKLETSPCGRYIFTIGEDGVLFVYQVSITYKDGTLVRKKMSDIKETQQLQMNPYISVVDDFLADIVMVNRGQIQEQVRVQKQLKIQIQQLQMKMTQTSLENKKKLDLQIRSIQTQKNKQIQDQKNKIQNLKKQIKTLQAKHDVDAKDSETKNLKAAQDLQVLYQRKLAIQNQKYFQLEQQMIQLKLCQKKQLEALNIQHSQNINLLKSEFMDSFGKAEKVYSATKQMTQKTQKVYDQKVSQMQDEYQSQIKQINQKRRASDDQTKRLINDLTIKLQVLKAQNKKYAINQQSFNNQKQQHQMNMKELMKQLDEIKQAHEEKSEQLMQKDQVTKNKDRLISELQSKISQLMKTKHVLSYKATQMRKSMEPKQAQIQKLKEQLFKLEQQFENLLQDQQKNIISMERVQKQKHILSKNLKQQSQKTKQKQLTIDKISMHVIKCMEARGKQIDYKFYYRQMANLYTNYIQNSGQKRPVCHQKGVDQMSRQLVHLEKSIVQVNKASQKVVVRRTQQISKKTKQNAELIYDLNQIRKINKQLQSELRSKQKTIDILERQKKIMQSVKVIQEQTTQKELQLQQKQFGRVNILKGSLDPINKQNINKEFPKKGKLVKGSAFDSHSQAMFSKAKIELSKTLQKNDRYLDTNSKQSSERPISEQIDREGLKSMAIQSSE